MNISHVRNITTSHTCYLIAKKHSIAKERVQTSVHEEGEVWGGRWGCKGKKRSHGWAVGLVKKELTIYLAHEEQDDAH